MESDNEMINLEVRPQLWGQVVFYPGHPGEKMEPPKAGGTNICQTKTQTCTQMWKAACSETGCSQLVHPCRRRAACAAIYDYVGL